MQKTRNSNIELLRIIAMIMILGLHVNFLAIEFPSAQDITLYPIQSFTRLFFESLCIVGVNVFVLISGWFGINYKPKGIIQFLFQCLFFSLVIFALFAITGKIEISRINIMSSFLLYKNAYWFVWAYLVLYLMAPMLNAFIEKSDKGYDTIVHVSENCFKLDFFLVNFFHRRFDYRRHIIKSFCKFTNFVV